MFGSNSPALKFAKPNPRVVNARAKLRLKQKQWQEVKAIVKKRDAGQCRACSKHGRRKPGTEVHHLLYRSHGGKDDAKNLILLCKDCHQDAHAKLLKITWRGNNPAAGVRFERVR